jgi:hypothetical protein|tara:strand:+ start:25228 stop:25773 length:546 start_codon:yes stop_codon:yes gene_type:complete
MAQNIRIESITGSRRFSNYFWTSFLFIGGLGFLLAGLSSYLKINLLPFTNSIELSFIPQGIVMIFYGSLSLSLSLYISFTIILDIGSGYNEYNLDESIIKIIRQGFPGENRNIFLTYPFENVKSIGIKITDGLSPKRTIFLCLKDSRKIPLTAVGNPMPIAELERMAADIAKFIDIDLENL